VLALLERQGHCAGRWLRQSDQSTSGPNGWATRGEQYPPRAAVTVTRCRCSQDGERAAKRTNRTNARSAWGRAGDADAGDQGGSPLRRRAPP
jgi:hypothetical protein